MADHVGSPHSVGQPGGGVQAVPLHPAVALPAEPQQQVVLRDHGAAGTGKVEREVRHVAAEIVHPEHELVGQARAVAPYHPADAERGETELVSGGVDGNDSGDVEAPFKLGKGEGGNESTRGTVNMDGDVQAGSLLQVIDWRKKG